MKSYKLDGVGKLASTATIPAIQISIPIFLEGATFVQTLSNISGLTCQVQAEYWTLYFAHIYARHTHTTSTAGTPTRVLLITDQDTPRACFG